MKRFPVRAAFGLAALLLAPPIAVAQLASGAKSAKERQPSRSFSRISFGPAPASAPVQNWPFGNRFVETLGAPLPAVTAAPEPHGTTAPCVMRVVPVDPRKKSNMPVVSVDDRADPKGVIKIPTCQPRD
jgi:hypothetical protein